MKVHKVPYHGYPYTLCEVPVRGQVTTSELFVFVTCDECLQRGER